MSLHRKSLAILSFCLGLGANSSFAGPYLDQVTATEVPSLWNRAVAFSLEARTVEEDAAFGVHVAHPVFHSPTSTVLVEAYGYEGEEELGVVGGGAVFRRKVGSRSSVEASVFFDGLRTTDGFSYPQIGVGLAFRPEQWLVLRANGYLPLRGKDSREGPRHSWHQKEGNGEDRREISYTRNSRFERAPMRGFDVEAEFRLLKAPRWVDPRLALGYAYREAEDRPEVYSGMTARGELHFAKYWIAEAEWRQDAHGIDQEWRVGLKFEMLFGAPEDSSGRPDETFLPVKRFPWPTVARGKSEGEKKRGESRALAPERPQEAADPEDCCTSGTEPLIFD